jgi:hypothetical protein
MKPSAFLFAAAFIQLTLATGEPLWLQRNSIYALAIERQGEARRSVDCPGQCTIVRYGSQGRAIVKETIDQILEKFKE